MSIDIEILDRFNTFLSEVIGVHYGESRRKQLNEDLEKISKAFGFRNCSDFVLWLVNSRLSDSDIDKLVAQITIGETYFFRDTAFFNLLRYQVLPEIINKRKNGDKRIRILSAGCSTGEEAYSIAMLLSELIPDIEKWNVVILGIDLNSTYLSKARKGEYTHWSFRQLPEETIDKYFTHSAGKYQIRQKIKEMVSFSFVNLLTDNFPSLTNNTTAFDLVSCRNVLMYFKPEIVNRVVDKLVKSLLNDGYLFVAGAETSMVRHSMLSVSKMKEIYFYQKTNSVVKNQQVKVLVERRAKPTSIKSRKILSQKTNTAKDEEKQIETVSMTNIKEHFDNGDYQKALEQIALLKMQTGVNSKALYIEIRIRSGLGQMKEAIELCDSFLTSEKLNPEPYLLKAQIEIELGNANGAIQLLDKAIYLEPELVIAHYLKGNLLRNENKPTQAEKSYRTAYKLIQANGSNDVVPYGDGVLASRMMEILTMKLNSLLHA